MKATFSANLRKTLIGLCSAWVALLSASHAQFSYSVDNQSATITKYDGPGGAISIPSAIDGLPVRGIAATAFSSNPQLISVTVPASVSAIGELAFVDCPKLVEIKVSAQNAYYSSLDGVLFNKNRTVLLQCPPGKSGAYTTPETVTKIGNNGFYLCGSLASISLPLQLTNIGIGAFSLCSSLGNLVIPNRVTTIGNGAFSFCTSLTNVAIGSGVKFLDDQLFYACTALENISIPKNITDIGGDVFLECTNLSGVYFEGDKPNVLSSPWPSEGSTLLYCLPGAKGWDSEFFGRPILLWNPVAIEQPSGFNIVGTPGITVVVETTPTLAPAVWTRLTVKTLVDGQAYVPEIQHRDSESVFYRLRSP
jgi:hypothetical protein